MQRKIHRALATIVHVGELLHRGLAAIGAELHRTLDPIGALSGNGALGQLVLQLKLEGATVKRALTFRLRNLKFAVLLLELVGRLLRDESRGGKNELQGMDLLQLLF